MSKEVQFPKIPTDPHSLALLGSLDTISFSILNAPEDDYAFRCAAFLHFLATAPLSADYIYFKVHENTRDMCRSLSDHYNHYIHSQGEAYKLEILNREIGSFGNHFNSFQLSLFHIDLKAKQNPNWVPLSDLIWGFYCSLYNHKKSNQFLELFGSTLKNIQTS
jgi:hypothetical protein